MELNPFIYNDSLKKLILMRKVKYPFDDYPAEEDGHVA
jgi:hypothetical protein